VDAVRFPNESSIGFRELPVALLRDVSESKSVRLVITGRSRESVRQADHQHPLLRVRRNEIPTAVELVQKFDPL